MAASTGSSTMYMISLWLPISQDAPEVFCLFVLLNTNVTKMLKSIINEHTALLNYNILSLKTELNNLNLTVNFTKKLDCK